MRLPLTLTLPPPHSQDLNDDDVMLVDTGDEVYCWIGSDASAMEKEKAFQVAKVCVADSIAHTLSTNKCQDHTHRCKNAAQ